MTACTQVDGTVLPEPTERIDSIDGIVVELEQETIKLVDALHAEESQDPRS